MSDIFGEPPEPPEPKKPDCKHNDHSHWLLWVGILFLGPSSCEVNELKKRVHDLETEVKTLNKVCAPDGGAP